jgi:hypothetical protein
MDGPHKLRAFLKKERPCPRPRSNSKQSNKGKGRQVGLYFLARKRLAFMKLAILLICCAGALGQDATTASQPTQKSETQDYGLGVAARGKQKGAVEILSDTQGVDFGPYLQRVVEDVRENWYHLIPKSAENKKGKLAIEFAITKDGQLADMRLVATSGDRALDRPAWGSITASNPFKPLPDKFKGKYLALRFRFYYNPNQ